MCRGKRQFLVGLLSVLIIMLIGWSEQTQSQEKYPTRDIEIVVTSTAGGSGDLTCRLLAAHLNKKWGVPVNVVNKPGGANVPGILGVHRAAPDGYTVLSTAEATTSILGLMVKDLPFDIMDFTFLGRCSTTPFVFCLPSTSPYKTLADLIAEAKRNPEKISYSAMGGLGVETSVRQFFRAIGADISKAKPVMTRGGSEVATMTAGGHIALGSATVASFIPAIQGGSVRPLFVTSKERYWDLPNVPISAEVGYPAVNFMSWTGISGPPKMPSYLVDRWEKALEEIVKDPEFVAQLKKIGPIASYLNAQELREHIIKEKEMASSLYAK